MFQYAISRILWLIPTLLAMALVTFLVMHATPGSPLDPVAEGANPLSPEAQKNLAAAYGLDKPLWQQYGYYLGGLATGDLGPSMKNKARTVNEIMAHTLPVSAALGLIAVLLALLLGLTAGIIAALRHNTAIDVGLMGSAPAGPRAARARAVDVSGLRYRRRRRSRSALPPGNPKPSSEPRRRRRVA